MEVLRALAPRLYPQSDETTAFKRMLLEDILFMARRRHARPEKLRDDPETTDLITNKFNQSLRNIFMYYTKISNRRRIADAGTSTKQRRNHMGAAGQVPVTDRGTSEMLMISKYYMSYGEFSEFVRDFKIVGGHGRQALLTVTECADIYLTFAPAFASLEEAIPNVDEASFRNILIYMAVNWSASLDQHVTRISRVKAFLLHMWKSLNTQQETIVEAAYLNKRVDLTQSGGGDLNICGSKVFNETFYAMWQKDGFCDYITDPSESEASGADLVHFFGETGMMSRRLGAMDQVDEPEEEEKEEEDYLGVIDLSDIVLKASDLRKLFASRSDIRDMVKIGLEIAYSNDIEEEIQIREKMDHFDVESYDDGSGSGSDLPRAPCRNSQAAGDAW